MEDTLSIELEMEQKLCGSCKKSSTDYFELQLQLRYKFFEDDEISALKEKTMGMLESNFNSINKIEELDQGFDIFFRNKNEMGKISTLFVKRFFVYEKRSAKIVGKDNLKSKDLYRHFQCITILNLGVGDQVRIKGGEYTIKAINKGNLLILLDNDTGAKKVMSYSIIHDYFQFLSKKVKPKKDLEKPE